MFVLLCIFGTVGGFLFYLGMFREILVSVGKPPLRKARIFYKVIQEEGNLLAFMGECESVLPAGMQNAVFVEVICCHNVSSKRDLTNIHDD